MATRAGAARHAVRLAVQAMGTRFEFLLAGEDPVRLRAIGEEALAEITACELSLSAFRPGSLVSRINRCARSRPVAVDADTFELLEESMAVHAASGGAFDITLGAAMRELGFRGTAPVSVPAHAPEQDRVRLDAAARTVSLVREGVELDLGGIAKGHALDRAADVLREHGVDRALLHGGTSTVVALGAPPGGAGWRVAIGPWPNSPIAELRDAALAVSAPHGRELVSNGQRIGHVLDPRTGRSTANHLASTAVLGRSARTVDAWSTALLVLGHDGELPSDLSARIAIRDDGGNLHFTARGAPTLPSARFLDQPPSPQSPR